jgi:hypothetical protein
VFRKTGVSFRRDLLAVLPGTVRLRDYRPNRNVYRLGRRDSLTAVSSAMTDPPNPAKRVKGYEHARMNDYLYDIFVSYRRAGNVAGWVQTHLLDVLQNCLADELDRKPEIFIDKRIETGLFWPDEIEAGLRHSRLMIAVLSPPYFTSKWCMAEWASMTLREEALNLKSGLILPLVFSDGDKFPDAAKLRQGRSMKLWGYPYPQFSQSPAFLEFHDEVRNVAQEIVPRLDAVPPWNAQWPIRRPDLVSAHPPAMLPEL